MLSKLRQTLDETIPLGQKSPYPENYDPGLLQRVSRARQREAMGFHRETPFVGVDIWNAYELCWLNTKGKPQRAVVSFYVPADSEFLVESKSAKLYLCSLATRRFSSRDEISLLIEQDLSKACLAPVGVEFSSLDLKKISCDEISEYECLDELDITIEHYVRAPELLRCEFLSETSEKLVTHLFKSHCLVTGQPDWGSIFIEYRGPKIDRNGLLAYLISFHNHSGFSENCIEQIYLDIAKHCSPKDLAVFGRFTRRGGIDINPYRSSAKRDERNMRLFYQ